MSNHLGARAPLRGKEGGGLAFTRDSFVYSGIAHWSILLLARNASFISTPVFCPQTVSRNVWLHPDPPRVCQAPSNIVNGNIV